MRISAGMVLDTIREGISYVHKGDVMMAEICRQSAIRKMSDGECFWSIHAMNGYNRLKTEIDSLRIGRPGSYRPEATI